MTSWIQTFLTQIIGIEFTRFTRFSLFLKRIVWFSFVLLFSWAIVNDKKLSATRFKSNEFLHARIWFDLLQSARIPLRWPRRSIISRPEITWSKIIRVRKHHLAVIQIDSYLSYQPFLYSLMYLGWTKYWHWNRSSAWIETICCRNYKFT